MRTKLEKEIEVIIGVRRKGEEGLAVMIFGNIMGKSQGLAKAKMVGILRMFKTN